MKKVSFVIPTYNEKENILMLLTALRKQEKTQNSYKYEVVVVDDDSPDQTAAAVRKKFSPPFVKLITRLGKRGLGTAIKEGILASSGEIIVGMDADFNHDPQALPKLLAELENYDFVSGSRFVKKGGMEEKGRYFSTLAFNLAIKHLLGFPITDNLSGYYAIRKKDLRKLDLEKIYYGYGDYHLRLVFYAKKKGLKFKEVPVYYRKRKYGKSKSNLSWMTIVYFKEAVKLRFFNER